MKPQIGYLHGCGARMELVVCWRSLLSYPRHNHVSVFTLGVVLEGAPRVAIGGGERVFLPGEAFLIPPYVPHSIGAQASCTLLSLCVKKDFAAGSCSGSLKRAAAELLGGLPALARALPADGNSPVEKARRALELHPEDKLSLDELAACAYTSKYSLIRAFKREVGLTPHQFQLQNRVRKAQRLLARTDSVAQAAADAGFFDQSHLVKQFKRAVGLAPMEYRAACGRLPEGCAAYTSAGINLANRHSPSGPADTSWATPLGRMAMVPGR